MTPSLITRLCNIASKPNTSATTQLITTRRICRVLTNRLDSIRAERRVMRRQAGKLKAFLPFTRQTISELERQSKEHRHDDYSGAKTVLAGFGRALMFDREGLAEALGFDALCDVLSVNPVRRQQARTDGDTSLLRLAYLSQLEDSSTGYGDEWGAGGPLYRACHAATTQFIKECPEHLLLDLFAPKLPPDLRIVGK